MELVNKIKKIQEIRRKNISYFQYLTTNLVENIKYSEFIAENIDKSISYSEYLDKYLAKNIGR